MISDIEPQLVREMLAKMGRNLLRHQLIETGLKLMLPLTHPEGSAFGVDAYSLLNDELKKKTLGGLRTHLLESIKTDDAKRFTVYLNEVIAGRNDFIHHFLQQPGVSINSNEGCHAAIRYLDRQFEFAEALFEIVSQVNIEIFRAVGVEVTGAGPFH